jgi:hypothetical protein
MEEMPVLHGRQKLAALNNLYPQFFIHRGKGTNKRAKYKGNVRNYFIFERENRMKVRNDEFERFSTDGIFRTVIHHKERQKKLLFLLTKSGFLGSFLPRTNTELLGNLPQPLQRRGVPTGFMPRKNTERSGKPLGRICNPAARNIRIYNPGKDVLSALKNADTQ